MNKRIRYEKNGFFIAINYVDGEKAQVFIDDLQGGQSIVEYMDDADVDGFIENNTRRIKE